MRSDCERLLACGRIPDLDCLVLAATDDLLAIGAEGHTRNGVGMSFEGERLLDEVNIPDLHRPVPSATATNNSPAVWTETDARDLA